MHKLTLQGICEGKLAGVDATRQGKNKESELKITYPSRCYQLGIQSLESIKQETLTHSFLVCGISNTLDGSEDDLVSDDLLSVEMEAEEGESSDGEDAQADGEDTDVDELEPFSEDSDSDPE